MIEIPILIAISAGTFVAGIVVGMLLHYYGDHRPLETRYEKLIQTLTYMKKQGFVPMFDVKQEHKYDPSEGVDES